MINSSTRLKITLFITTVFLSVFTAGGQVAAVTSQFGNRGSALSNRIPMWQDSFNLGTRPQGAPGRSFRWCDFGNPPDPSSANLVGHTGRFWLSEPVTSGNPDKSGTSLAIDHSTNMNIATTIDTRINFVGHHCTFSMQPESISSIPCSPDNESARRSRVDWSDISTMRHCSSNELQRSLANMYLPDAANVKVWRGDSEVTISSPTVPLTYHDAGQAYSYKSYTSTVKNNLGLGGQPYGRGLTIRARESYNNQHFYWLGRSHDYTTYTNLPVIGVLEGTSGSEMPAGVNVSVVSDHLLDIRKKILDSGSTGLHRVEVRIPTKIMQWRWNPDNGVYRYIDCFGAEGPAEGANNLINGGGCPERVLSFDVYMNVQHPEVKIIRQNIPSLTEDDVKDQNIRVRQGSAPSYSYNEIQHGSMEHTFTGMSLGSTTIVASQNINGGGSSDGRAPQRITMQSRWCPYGAACEGWSAWGPTAWSIQHLTRSIPGSGRLEVRVRYESMFACSMTVTPSLLDSGGAVNVSWETSVPEGIDFGAEFLKVRLYEGGAFYSEYNYLDTPKSVSFNPIKSQTYRAVIINPSNPSNELGDCSGEVVVRSKMPYLYIGGGDLYSGVALPKTVPSGGDPCDISDRGAIVTSGSSPDANKGRLRGSSTAQYGVFAAGSISSESGARRTNFGGNHNYLRSGFNDLLFATNTSISGPERYGNFDATCVHEDDLYRSLGVNVAAVTDVDSSSALASILGDGSSSIRISGNWTAGESDPIQERKVIIVEGNITLNGNIEYNGSYGLGGIPRITLISRGGDIRIGQNVSRIDANLIALPENEGAEGGGKIDTCYNITIYNQLTTLDCNQQLNLNGLVVAQRIAWKRTHGTLSGSVISPGGCQHSTAEYDKNCAAERAERHPATYLPQSGGSTVRSIPITTRELPPVY